MNWDEAISRLGGVPQPTDLEARYGEAHRRYHNFIHAQQVARDATALTKGRDQALVALAAWAHDVVYKGNPGEDERESAAWARRHLAKAGVPETDIARVEDLVLATIEHEPPPGDHAAAALMDADLAILATPPRAYEAYRQAVRAEYAHVPEETWRTGRAAVLRSLLSKNPLYRTPAAQQQWTTQAHHNLRTELTTLI
jgi:predicted metal-dependent HD superfamily phosphohydrolase